MAGGTSCQKTQRAHFTSCRHSSWTWHSQWSLVLPAPCGSRKGKTPLGFSSPLLQQSTHWGTKYVLFPHQEILHVFGRNWLSVLQIYLDADTTYLEVDQNPQVKGLVPFKTSTTSDTNFKPYIQFASPLIANPMLWGFLWRLHYVSMFDSIIGYWWLSSISSPFPLPRGCGLKVPNKQLIIWLVPQKPALLLQRVPKVISLTLMQVWLKGTCYE